MSEQDELLDDVRPVYDAVVVLSEEERGLLMNELETLFILHDRPASEKKRAVFVVELGNLNIPVKYIFQGIRKLQQAAGLKSIEFWRIRKEADDAFKKDFKTVECEDCGGSGVVSMLRVDTEFRGSEALFACRCSNGTPHMRGRLAVWNGQRTMFHKTEVQSYTGGFLEISGNFVHWPRKQPRPQIVEAA